MNTSSPLKIDIISDVVCPWCVVGYRQLLQALNVTNTAYELTWHPFELNPDMGPEGQNLREHIMEKYGTTAEESEKTRNHITKMGKEVGFDFAFRDDMRMYNTFDAHQLLHWAGEEGKANDLKQAFFATYFTDQKNLSDRDVLADVAASVGLEKVEALKVLKDQRFAQNVRQLENFWHEQGILSVPAIVFKSKHLVSGAQGIENYIAILQQLVDLESAEG